MSRETALQNDAPEVTELVIGAIVQMVYLSVVVGFLLLLPPFLSYVTPFSFPFRHGSLVFFAAVIFIGLAVTLDVILQVTSRD